MDMGTSTAMSMPATGTEAAASATSTAMSMSMGGDCKISMLWNWYTIDSCFISSSWHVTSKGMFAGSCIGVILLVMSLELLRRLGKEYDRYILRQYQRASVNISSPSAQLLGRGNGNGSGNGKDSSVNSSTEQRRDVLIPSTFRPNIVQQAVRATLHMVQFAVAYFVMLLAMYYNGYFIICIIIGAWLGAFVFSWESVDFGGPKEEATVCCG